MTRRTVDPRIGRLGVSANQMAKGGRVASESRIRRMPILKVISDTPGVIPEPVDPGLADPVMLPIYATSFYAPDMASSADEPLLPYAVWADHHVPDGAIVTFQFFGENAGALPTPPPGWNILFQGVVGGLSWLFTWARCTPTLNENWTTTDASVRWTMIIRAFDHTNGWTVAGTFVNSAAGSSTATFPGGNSHGYRFPQPQVAIFNDPPPTFQSTTDPAADASHTSPWPQITKPNMEILSKHPAGTNAPLYDPDNPSTAVIYTLQHYRLPSTIQPATGSVVSYIWGLVPQ